MPARRKAQLINVFGRLLAVTILAAAVLAPVLSLAQTLVVDGGTTLSIPPDISNDYVIVGDLSGGTINQTGGTNTINNDLTLGNTATGSGTYSLSGTGSLTAGGHEFIGYSGTGSFTQSGGPHSLSQDLYLGYAASSNGTYNLSNGSIEVAQNGYVGFSGSGAFTQSGGSHTVTGDLYLGYDSSGSGAYNLSGTGRLAADMVFVGYNGAGTFTQSGGTHTLDDGCGAGELILGQNPGSSGTYNLSGGSLSATYVSIGVDGTGVFNQTGGAHTLDDGCGTGGLALGQNAGSSGTYNLSGGSLSAAYLVIGVDGTGVFNQTGGTNTIGNICGTGVLGVGLGGTGTYNLSGGTLTVDGAYIGFGGTGIFTQSGGSHTAFEIYLAEDCGCGSGTYNLQGGSLYAGTVYLNANGVFNQTGGSLYATTFYQQGGEVQGSLENRGTFNYDSGTFSGDLRNYGTANIIPGATGTLTIGGNFTQDAGGTLTVEIASASSYDILNVTGAASLNGTLRPVLLGGYVPQNHQVFANVVTAGAINGTFSQVANFTPTLLAIPRYSATSVDLVVARDYTNPALNLTPNQRAVGNMLNGLANGATGDLNQVLNTIDGLGSGSEVANAYQQISPDKAASLATLGFAGTGLFRQGLANRITNLRYGSMGGTGGLGGLGGLGLSGSRLDGLMLAYNSSSLAGLVTAKKKAAPETPWGLYLDPGLVLGSQKSTSNQTGYNFTIAGFTAGADYRVTDDLLVGLATGYSHTGADFRGSGGSVENHTWPLTAYAAYLPESFYAYGSLGYALNLFSLERQLSFGDLSRKASSSPAGHQFNAYGEAGYDVKANALVVTPLVSLAYSRVWVNSFTESGAGSLNLEVASQQADSLQTGVGAKIAAPLKRNGVTVVPQVYATYQHEFSNNSRGLDARLSQGGSTFVFQTEQLGQDFAVAGASVTIMTPKNFSLQLNYNAEVGRANYTAHTINTGVRWEF